MSIKMEFDGQNCRIAIEGPMTVSEAEALKHALLSPLAEKHEFVVDLSGVSAIDYAGLQLLVMLKLESYVRDSKLQFVSRSAAVREIIELCELAEFFEKI